ncbi:AMP-dependent synthetase [Mycobacterium intracellulare subsp. chimaera]|nr:AMP-dependent synthetase [Mycobacterium intracellulare subsp. chimaera]ARV81771.1 AMP-dependent synthetase [Mycobacterium intracellulare subsp. chimaera]ASL08873.1 AMP-dependent synthetase and ligase [Mycobacterium intracellulare subsp. chimaera]ASL20655.1 AMP-dependent synthetase and ligase [Mycobacterium intracellulare subsp. chimaera]KPN52636.1 AMP-dependent synthetase [Mycobacterium intracellulare subsp. chimaera]
MTDPTELLRHARRRAEGLRPRYRAAGSWTAEPIDLVGPAAARHPSRLAVADRGAELTYGELDKRIDSAARAMVDAGLAPGSAIVVVVGNDVDSVVSVHAALRVDAVVLLVPRSAGATQIADILTRTGARFGVAPNWATIADAELSGLCEWIELGDDGRTGTTRPPRPVRAADEPCLVLYTSGTTARPKGVIHSLSTLAKASANYIAAAGLGSDDRIFLISPLASVTGVLQALFIGPMLAAPVILEDRWDPAATCDLLVSSGATWYGGPDRLLDRMLDRAVARRAVVPLRAVYLGGTMLDRRIVERIEDEFGIVVMRAYGSSETPVSTSGLRTEPRDIRHADDGVALGGVDVRVGSESEPTECCIKGPHTFLGYTDAEDDEYAFEGEWFRTGDVAEVVGGRVRIVGRIKDIVIRNGLKIPAAEVEEAVSRIGGIRECAAYSVSDPTTGERLAMAVVLEPGVEISLAEITRTLGAEGMPKYKLPEELVLWDEPLPVNANGKVDRAKLEARSVGRPRLLADRLATTG